MIMISYTKYNEDTTNVSHLVAIYSLISHSKCSFRFSGWIPGADLHIGLTLLQSDHFSCGLEWPGVIHLLIEIFRLLISITARSSPHSQLVDAVDSEHYVDGE